MLARKKSSLLSLFHSHPPSLPLVKKIKPSPSPFLREENQVSLPLPCPSPSSPLYFLPQNQAFPQGRKSSLPSLYPFPSFFPSLLPHLIFFPKIKPFPREENQTFPPFPLLPLPFSLAFPLAFLFLFPFPLPLTLPLFNFIHPCNPEVILFI